MSREQPRLQGCIFPLKFRYPASQTLCLSRIIQLRSTPF